MRLVVLEVIWEGTGVRGWGSVGGVGDVEGVGSVGGVGRRRDM